MTRFNTQALNDLPFSEVVEAYSTITHKGANDFTLCPWHDDKNPSLLIGGSNHPHRCKCFACGKGGSVIDYVMAKNNWDFKEACEALSREFNIDPLETPSSPSPSSFCESVAKRTITPPLWGEGVTGGTANSLTKYPRKHIGNYPHGSPHRGGDARREEGVLEGVTGGKGKRKAKKKHPTIKEILQKAWSAKPATSVPPAMPSVTPAPHRGGELGSGGEGVFYFPLDYLEKHLSSDSTFCDCLRALFVEQGIEYAVEAYKLGSYAMGERRGFVMFPSIDAEGRCHNVKIQRYCTDRNSPQFFHKEEKSTYWLASILQKRGKLPSEAKYDSGCFFGEHLLTERPGDVVVLVESPKNAIIGFLDNTMYVWVAVGNKSNLTRKRLECLRGRKVIVIPDKDAVEEWKHILEGMKDIATFELSSFCEMGMKELGDKGDVADYLIEKLKI